MNQLEHFNNNVYPHLKQLDSTVQTPEKQRPLLYRYNSVLKVGEHYRSVFLISSAVYDNLLYGYWVHRSNETLFTYTEEWRQVGIVSFTKMLTRGDMVLCEQFKSCSFDYRFTIAK